MPSRSARRSRHIPAMALLCLLPLLALPIARAGEEEEQQGPELRMAIFEVGALTRGVPGWIRARGPSFAEDARDEESPLFGFEVEEAHYPIGEISELVEIVKRSVSPSTWETLEGADIIEFGADRLVVRAPRALVLEVQRYLIKQEQRILRPLTIELQARRALDAEATTTIARFSGDLSNEAWSEVISQSQLVQAATVTVLEGQHGTARSGTQRAWLATYEGLNSEVPLSADPTVRAANLGLCAGMRALRVGPGRVRVSIDCVLANLVEVTNVQLGRSAGGTPGPTVQTPSFTRTSASGEYLLRSGTWQVIQAPAAGTDLLLLARVHDGLEPAPGAAERVPPATVPFLPQAPRGGQPGMSLEQYDCAGLESRRQSRRAPERALYLSNFTLPEPPELEEPSPIFPNEAIPDLLFSTARAEDWEEPATIEVRGGQLHVRNTAAVQTHVAKLLDALRAQFTASIMLEVQVIEGSLDLLDELALETVGRGTLETAQLDALRSAVSAGRATHLGRQRLRSRGNLAAESSGTEARYVADYEVDRPKSGIPSARAITGEVFTGMQVEARAMPVLDGRSVRVDLDVWRSTAQMRPASAVQTPHGTLQVPTMDVTRLQGTAKVLLGQTHVVAGAIVGDRVQLVLVRARWE